jgi:hypothetical protein
MADSDLCGGLLRWENRDRMFDGEGAVGSGLGWRIQQEGSPQHSGMKQKESDGGVARGRKREGHF